MINSSTLAYDLSMTYRRKLFLFGIVTTSCGIIFALDIPSLFINDLPSSRWGAVLVVVGIILTLLSFSKNQSRPKYWALKKEFMTAFIIVFILVAIIGFFFNYKNLGSIVDLLN